MFITWQQPHSHSMWILTTCQALQHQARSHHSDVVPDIFPWNLLPLADRNIIPLTPHSSRFCPASSSYCPSVCRYNIDCSNYPDWWTGPAFGVCDCLSLQNATCSEFLWVVACIEVSFLIVLFFFFYIWWCWRLNSGHSPCKVSPLLLSHTPRQDSLPF